MIDSKVKAILFLASTPIFYLAFSAQTALAVDCTPYPPLGGAYTISTTPSCSFSGTPNGAANGGITVSAGVNLIIPASSTVVWGSGQTVTLTGTTASISVNAASVQLKQSNLWMVDADSDGWPATTTQYEGVSQPSSPTGLRLRNLMNVGSFNTSTGVWTTDCVDTDNTKPPCYTYSYAYNYAYAYNYGYAYTYAYNYGYAYGYAYNYGYAYGYAYNYGYAYDYGYAYGYAYNYGYAYDYGYAYNYGYAYDYGYAYGYSYAEGGYGYGWW